MLEAAPEFANQAQDILQPVPKQQRAKMSKVASKTRGEPVLVALVEDVEKPCSQGMEQTWSSLDDSGGQKTARVPGYRFVLIALMVVCWQLVQDSPHAPMFSMGKGGRGPHKGFVHYEITQMMKDMLVPIECAEMPPGQSLQCVLAAIQMHPPTTVVIQSLLMPLSEVWSAGRAQCGLVLMDLFEGILHITPLGTRQPHMRYWPTKQTLRGFQQDLPSTAASSSKPQKRVQAVMSYYQPGKSLDPVDILIVCKVSLFLKQIKMVTECSKAVLQAYLPGLYKALDSCLSELGVNAPGYTTLVRSRPRIDCTAMIIQREYFSTGKYRRPLGGFRAFLLYADSSPSK